VKMGAGDTPDARNRAERIASVLSYFILLGGAATIGLALYMVVTCYSSLPWSDGWTQILVAARKENPFSLRWLWQLHNEHRLLIPKLFLAIDLRGFAATQRFLLASIFVIQLLHWWLLNWSMRALGGWRGAMWRTGSGLAAFCLFCPSQWENLTWGFQTCFVLPPLFATLSFIALLYYWMTAHRRREFAGWKLISLSLLAATAGILSLANGLLLLPLLLLAALLLRLRWSVIATYVVASIFSFTLYFHGYVSPPQTSHPASSIRSPIKLIEYIATYFGSSWGYSGSWTHHNLVIALGAGLTGLILALLFLLRFRFAIQASQVFSMQLLLLLLFCLGTSAITALGRVASGNAQAFSSRYQTIALLFWWCLGCLVPAFASKVPKPSALLVTEIFLVCVLLRGWALARFPLRDAREHAFQQRAAAAALISEVNDTEQIERAFPQADAVLSVVPFMRDSRLSIFAHNDRPSIGSAFTPELLPQQECRGAIQTVSAIAGGGERNLRFTGWAFDVIHRNAPSYIVVEAEGHVVGLGAIGDWRPTIRSANPYLNTSFIGFTAYAKNITTTSPLEIYAIPHDSSAKACDVADVQPSQRQ
jgi:hypothetical protein